LTLGAAHDYGRDMSAAVLTIGTEITRGEIVDTNSAWLCSRLTALGFEVLQHETVDDDRGRIVEVLREVSRRANVVIVTGGLGPTTDDLTAACAAEALGVDLVRDEPSLESIQRRLAAAGRSLTPSNARMADVPRGSEVLGNPVGTAPAFGIKLGSALCYFLPGVPREMTEIFDELVTPRIGPLASSNAYQIVLRTYGLPESLVGERLDGLEVANPGLRIGYRATFPETEVKVRVKAGDPSAARSAAERIAEEVRTRLGDIVYGEGDDRFAAAVGRALRARGYTLAVAESCTGGLIGALLTEIPGSSDYLLLDAVTYSNKAKEHVLGVPAEVLIGHGAVSPECVTSMAEGVRRIAEADIAVAVSGIAGPGGGTSEKPVGLVVFAVSTSAGTTTFEKRFPGDRLRVQRGAAFYALSLVRDACKGPLPVPAAPRCG
jgi:nicotinamide-nucleotide amidase